MHRCHGWGVLDGTPGLVLALRFTERVWGQDLALLAQQLSQLPNFSGDNLEGDGETFDDWIEQLELACGWNERTGP